MNGKTNTYIKQQLLKKILENDLNEIKIDIVKHIGGNAFRYCSNLTSVDFPNCSYIGGQAFYGCSNLTSVDFPICSYISNYAFEDCFNFLELRLTETTTTPINKSNKSNVDISLSFFVHKKYAKTAISAEV